MKRLLFIVTSLIICNSISAQDFRKVSWGDSKADIKSLEPRVDWEESHFHIYDYMSFKTIVASLNTTVTYILIDDQLIRSRYSFKTAVDQTIIPAFNLIEENLKAKYGDGDRQDIWKDEEYKNQPDQYWLAIATGDYSIINQWTVSDITTIIHIVGGQYIGGNFDADHELEYTSMKHDTFEKQKLNEAESIAF